MSRRSVLVLISVSVILAGLPSALAGKPIPQELTFEDRVNAQLAIERVYNAHRFNSTRRLETPAVREVMAEKVRRYLARSLELEQRRNQPITTEMLDREVERMMLQTRLPERLSELFEALEKTRL